MRRLFPCSPAGPSASAPVEEHALDGLDSLDALADAYAYPDLDGPQARRGSWLRANMVSSLDGAVHHKGHSKPLSSEADMRVFGVLRALADVVVVGAETVRQEGYGPVKRRPAFQERRAAAGQSPAAAVAVVSASLELDLTAPLFTEARVPTLVVTGSQAPAERLEAVRRTGAEVVFAGDGAVADPALVPGALAERGLRRQLAEGGPRLLGALASAGALDELCLTLSPRITSGEAPRILNGPTMDVPADLGLEAVLEEAGFLFTRYRRI